MHTYEVICVSDEPGYMHNYEIGDILVLKKDDGSDRKLYECVEGSDVGLIQWVRDTQIKEL